MSSSLSSSVFLEQTSVLFVSIGSRYVPYHRPQKLPLSMEMHKTLRDNAYCNQWTKNECLRNAHKLDPGCIESWLDYEASLYDLPKPGHPPVEGLEDSHRGTAGGNRKAIDSVTFPEDLDRTFHSGLLDVSLNSEQLSFEPNTASADVQTSGVSEPDERGQVIVPDCDDASLAYDHLETGTDSLYPCQQDKTLLSHVTNSRADEVRIEDALLKSKTVPSSHLNQLPLLFYPRSKRKQSVKQTKSLKKYHHK